MEHLTFSPRLGRLVKTPILTRLISFHGDNSFLESIEKKYAVRHPKFTILNIAGNCQKCTSFSNDKMFFEDCCFEACLIHISEMKVKSPWNLEIST